MLKYLLTFVFVLMSIVTYTQKRFVFEMDIEKYRNDTIEITHYKSPKCYFSNVIIEYNKESVTIKTDSMNITIYVLKRFRKNNKPSNYTEIASMLCVIRDKVFYLREFYNENTYFCVLRPIKLTRYNRNL